MKRKNWIITLLLCMLVTLCTAFISCGQTGVGGDFTVSFRKDVATEVYASKDIDLDDYIVKVDGATHEVTVEYYSLISGKVVSEKFSGNNMVFYPKMVGEHTLTYQATVGKTTKSATMKISVISDPPTITISHTAQTIPMPDKGYVTRAYELLMSNASMALKPMTATTKIVGASFRGVHVGLDSQNETWEKITLEEGAETFTFTSIGEYQFFVRATSEGNFSEDYFLVNVIKDPSAGTSKADGTKVVETGRGVVYAENDPYTFKLMSGNLAEINYAVLADSLGDGKKLSLVFKGKNAPQLGFYVTPDPTNGEYNLKTSKGGFFSFVAKESSGHKWVFFFPNMLTGDAARTPIPGRNDFGLDDLDNDKYYLMQYSLRTVMYVEEREAWRLQVNVEIYEALSYSTEGENSVCTKGEKLHEIGVEGEFYYEKGKEFDFTQGRSVIYGDIRNNIDVQYIPGEKNILQAPKEEILVEGTDNIYSYKSNVTKNEDGSITANLHQGKWMDSEDTGISDQFGYVGIANSGFGMGKTITLDFVGKNLPGVGIYLDGAPDGYVVGGATASGTGYYIGNGNISGEDAIGKRLIVNGPYRLDPGGEYRGNQGYPPYFSRVDGLSYFGAAQSGEEGFNESAKMGYNLLEDDKNYRFEITDSSAQYAPNFEKFALTYKLYDMSGSQPVLLEEVTKTVDRDFDTPNFKSQTIAFFGSIHQNIRFTYSLSGERTEFPFAPEIDPEAITLKPARITETKDASGNAIGFSGTYDYVGLGKYEVGDVLEFRFTGKNIPNVGLFVNQNGANPIGEGTKNTGIFLQTSGHGTSTYDKRLYITAPFLLDAGSEEPYKTVEGLKDTFNYRGWVGANHEVAVDISNEGKTSLFGMDMLESRVKYAYRVWTEAGSDVSRVVIKTELFKIEGETRTSVAQFTREIPHYLPSLENTYAVLYGGGSYSNKEIRVAYTVNPDATTTSAESGARARVANLQPNHLEKVLLRPTTQKANNKTRRVNDEQTLRNANNEVDHVGRVRRGYDVRKRI